MLKCLKDLSFFLLNLFSRNSLDSFEIQIRETLASIFLKLFLQNLSTTLHRGRRRTTDSAAVPQSLFELFNQIVLHVNCQSPQKYATTMNEDDDYDYDDDYDDYDDDYDDDDDDDRLRLLLLLIIISQPSLINIKQTSNIPITYSYTVILYIIYIKSSNLCFRS